MRSGRLRPIGVVLTVTAALVLPGLGSFGFWDPLELPLADRARVLAESGDLIGHLAVAFSGEATVREPPLNLFLAAIGIRLLGVGELGARIFAALCAILAVWAVYWTGSGLFRRRAGVLGALVLLSMPAFLLQARHLTTSMPLIAALALSMGGLGRYAWPAGGRRSWRDLSVAGLGLVLGLLAGGALIGVALPCLAVTGTFAACWTISTRPAESDRAARLTQSGTGRDVAPGASLGQSLLLSGTHGRLVLALVALGGLLMLVLTLTTANVAGRFTLLLGGVPAVGTSSHTFDYLIRQIGFGVFPWSALTIFALGRGLTRLGSAHEPDGGRLAFHQTYMLMFAAFGVALGAVFVVMTGEARFPVLAPIALSIGAFLDEALEGEWCQPLTGLLVAVGTLVVARDLFLRPEEVVSVHLLGQKIKWPLTLSYGYVFLITGVVVALGLATGLAVRAPAIGEIAPIASGPPGLSRDRLLAAVLRQAGRWGIRVAVGVALAFAASLAFGIVPMLSRHLSLKTPLQSLDRFIRAGQEVARYRVEVPGGAFYRHGRLIDMDSQARLIEYFRQTRRVFSLISADDLAALDAAFKVARLRYHVVDASGPRLLFISNQLLTHESDLNPLKHDVWISPRPPVRLAGGESQARYHWDERPDWKWRVPLEVSFQGGIELVGADFPSAVTRPGKLPLTLIFRANTRAPAGYKIFAHVDAAGGARLQGDHAPLVPTAHWLPGEYIRDRHDLGCAAKRRDSRYLHRVRGAVGRRTKRQAIARHRRPKRRLRSLPLEYRRDPLISAVGR
jgi:hypothetical protein